MKTDYKKLSQEAERILKAGAPLILEGYSNNPGADTERTLSLKTQEKSSHKDLVTFFDKRMDEYLKESFQKSFPGMTVVGEENVAAGSKPLVEILKGKESFWIFDPIDGTTNFSRAYPFFCTTVALVEKTAGKMEMKVAVTLDPVRNETFIATKGGGAYLNKEKLKVSAVNTAPQALLSTGFASEKSTKGDRSFELFKKLTKLTLGVRRDGSAALDLAFVANGRTDGYWEWGLSPWDIAAGILLVEEAGGICSHHDGSEIDFFSGEILASNGFLHKWLVDRIKE